MKALSNPQKKAYDEVKPWLRKEMDSRRIVYMSDCPIETLKHIPIRGLGHMVKALNRELGADYVLGAAHTWEQDVRKVAVVDRRMSFDESDISGTILEAVTVAEDEELLFIEREGKIFVEHNWKEADGWFEESESFKLGDAAREFERDERSDLADIVANWKTENGY